MIEAKLRHHLTQGYFGQTKDGKSKPLMPVDVFLHVLDEALST
jgi:hypothetical protein